MLILLKHVMMLASRGIFDLKRVFHDFYFHVDLARKATYALLDIRVSLTDEGNKTYEKCTEKTAKNK